MTKTWRPAERSPRRQLSPLPEAPTEIGVTMLLCDSAQSVGGKLYILGGGWSQVQVPNVPIPMAVAVRLAVPWDRANQRLPIRIYLVTRDGDPVDIGAGPIEATANVEVGRPAGLERGTPLVAMLAINAGAVPLSSGRYVWELAIEDKIMAREPFQVMEGPPTVGGYA